MADGSPSSPPTSKSLKPQEGRISPSTEGESQNHQSSSSPFQRPSQDNVSAPIRLPPPLPRAADKSTPGSQARPRTRTLRSEKPMATSDILLRFGLNSPPPPNNSETLQELGPQGNPITYGITQNPISVISRDNDGVQQNSPLPISAQIELIKEILFSEWEQDLPPSSEKNILAGQDLPSGMDPVSVLTPPFSKLLNITQPLQCADNSPCPPSPESVASNDGEADHSGDNNQGGRRQTQPPIMVSLLPQRMIQALFPPEDGDPDPGVWVGPPPGYFKLNVAVVLCNVGGVQKSGLGAVVRDHFGVAQIALSVLCHDPNPDAAESFIYEMGIVYSQLLGYNWLIAETERLLLAQQYGLIALIPGLYFENFNYFHARQVSGSANTAAHIFARLAPVRDDIYWTSLDIANNLGTNSMPF